MNDFSLISITGVDAKNFLQSQLTCDVNQLANNEWTFMACCNRKGRVIANGLLYYSNGDNYFFIVPTKIVSILVDHLKRYAAFSKVKLEAVNPSALVLKEEITEAMNAPGISWIQPETSELFTPQMINWQKLGGVSFKKGCYIGQEVVARTEHLGQLKRHLYTGDLQCNENHQVGDVIFSEQNEAGIITKISDKKFLAVIQDQFATQQLRCAHQQPCNDVTPAKV